MNDIKWINIKDRQPPTDEPIVYCRQNPRDSENWHVGIAYWTISKTWNPEAQSKKAPSGFSYWIPLPSPPKKEVGN